MLGKSPFLHAPNQELLSRHSVFEMIADLKKKEKILYSSNGNRALSGKTALKGIRSAAIKAGITRLANIAGLESPDLPVFQSARPNIMYHYATGMNTSSQGKGLHTTQAMISALGESIETYCAEPKNIKLVRGSYEYLKNQHVVADPSEFATLLGRKRIRRNEVVMWTEAIEANTNRPVWMPAETVFIPFFNRDYGCRSVLPISSNGLASGSTYLEAAIHGLYEVIERHYQAQSEFGKALSAVVDLETIEYPAIRAKLRSLKKYNPILVAYTFPGIRNLPMVKVMLYRRGQIMAGYGCSADIEGSMSRGISEAWQAAAGMASGAREDIASKAIAIKGIPKRYLNEKFDKEFLSVANFKKRAFDKRFSDLQDEYQFILRWLRRHGSRNVYIANLTRRGIDLPVVKVVVPPLRAGYELFHIYSDSPKSSLDHVARRYGVKLPK